MDDNGTASVIHLRLARPEDAIQLLPLMEQLGYPSTLTSLQKRLKIYSNSKTYYILIAEANKNITGVLALVMYEMFVFDKKRCRIEALIIDKKYQRQGIGRQLMEYAEILAKQKGCKLVELTSGLKRAKKGAHTFYKSLGYSNDVLDGKLYLRKDL